MGTKICYIGPYSDGVEIETSGGVHGGNGVYVGRGETVEVDSELAERLLEQTGVWARPSSQAAKKAVAKKAKKAVAKKLPAQDPAVSPAVDETVSDDTATAIDESQSEEDVNA